MIAGGEGNSAKDLASAGAPDGGEMSQNATQPIIICGVPDSLGNLPIIDGTNATAQAGVSEDGAAAGTGIISVWAGGYGQGTPAGFYQDGSAGPSYITITGLHIAHGTPAYNYTPPGGGALTPYNPFTACVNLRSGTYIDIGGNDLDTCGLGLFSDDNGNSGWVVVTQLLTFKGNHIEGSGIAGSAGEHQLYIQSWYTLVEGNLIDKYNPLAGGSEIKSRAPGGIYRYNNLASGAARLLDFVEEEDLPQYTEFEVYLGAPGDTNCNDSLYCTGDTIGPNIMAAHQETFQSDFVYGNELFGQSTQSQIHYLGDNGGGMNVRNGTLYFFSNTLDAAQDIFDIGSNGDEINGYFPPRIDARNNIFWASVAPYNGAAIQMAFGSDATIIMSATTNLMKAGTFTIQPPIEGAPWSNNTEEGWSNACDGICFWPLSVPLDPHLYGLTNANYLTTATQPYNPTTMVPPAGSAAINAGAALTGVLQTMPVRWQYSIATNSLIPRLNPQTIGAVDFAPEAVTPTFSPSAGDYASAPTVTLQTTTPSAGIYYTTDGSTPTYPATGTTKLYGGAITVASSETLQAIAEATGYVTSTIGSAAYGVGPLAATPVFSPAGGTYAAIESVTISDATPGATIYYTTDGSTPTYPVSGTTQVYGGPISVSVNETLQAMAAAPNYSNSDVGSASYTINIPQTAAPTLAPPAGTYVGTQTVTISDATTGAAIYYTTNGSTPTAASTRYTGPITVSATEIVEAVAIAAGDSPSVVANAAYNIAGPFTGPAVIQQCNNFVQTGTTVSCTLNGIGAGHTLVIGTSNVTTGHPGTATASSGTPILATKDGDSLSAWYLPNTSAGSNTITWTIGATTNLWLSVVEYGNTAASPLDGIAETNLSTSLQASGFLNTPDLTTTSASDVLWSVCSGVSGAPTVGTSPVAWAALASSPGGSVFVETGDAGAAGAYYGQCASNEGEIVSLALKPAGATAAPAEAATPTFSPAGGTFSSAQSVTISDATPGVTIYYTTNGTQPSSGSSVYSGPISVSASETLEAMAVSSSTSQSAFASATFTVNAQTPTPTPAITWPTPAAIAYGTALGSAQLNATSTVAGTFHYSPAAGTILAAGNQSLTATFTPTATGNSSTATVTASVTLTVNKATPTITWNAPAAVPVGTVLSATQLDATSTVAGKFSYSPTAGAVLAAGSQTLTTTFTPTDTTDYSSATDSVTLAVVPAGVSPVFVQQCNQYDSFGTTASCTLSGVGAGHTLLIGIAGAGTMPGTLTTTSGTAKLVVQDGSFMSAYMLANTSTGNITITFTATTATKIHMSVAEYANTAASPLDGVASFASKGLGNIALTPSFNTTMAGDLLWSFCGSPGGTVINPGTSPVAWTKRVSPNGTGMALLVEDGVTKSPGAYFGLCTGADALMEIVTVALKP